MRIAARATEGIIKGRIGKPDPPFLFVFRPDRSGVGGGRLAAWAAGAAAGFFLTVGFGSGLGRNRRRQAIQFQALRRDLCLHRCDYFARATTRAALGYRGVQRQLRRGSRRGSGGDWRHADGRWQGFRQRTGRLRLARTLLAGTVFARHQGFALLTRGLVADRPTVALLVGKATADTRLALFAIVTLLALLTGFAIVVLLARFTIVAWFAVAVARFAGLAIIALLVTALLPVPAIGFHAAAIIATGFVAIALTAIGVAAIAVVAIDATVRPAGLVTISIVTITVAAISIVTIAVVSITIIAVIVAAILAPVLPAMLLRAFAGAVVETLVGVHLAVFALILVGLTIGLAVALTVIPIAALLLLLFVKARAGFAEYAEIMIGELQIIFRHHPIALTLGVAGEGFVLLMKLAGIAARAIIEPAAPIGRTTTTIRTGRTPGPSTAAAVLTIVDQLFAAFVTGGICSPLLIRARPGPIKMQIRTSARPANAASASTYRIATGFSSAAIGGRYGRLGKAALLARAFVLPSV